MNTIAMSEPGILRENFGVRKIITTLSIPTVAAHQFMVSKWRIYTPHLAKKSDGTLSIVNPKRSFICVEKMVRAIPAVNPTTMG